MKILMHSLTRHVLFNMINTIITGEIKLALSHGRTIFWVLNLQKILANHKLENPREYFSSEQAIARLFVNL